MSMTLVERYSSLILTKLRAENILKDGIVFNNDYEGDPKSGAVKISVANSEVAVSDYDRTNGINAGITSTSYQTLVINKDKAVGEIIDGYEAACVPVSIIADRIDSAGYALAHTMDIDGGTALLAEGTPFNTSSLDDDVTPYDLIIEVRKAMSKANVPNDGRRYLLVTPDFYASLLKDKDHFVSPSNLGDDIKQTGAVGKIAGFTVYEWNDSTANLLFIAGHPKFATRVNEWSVPVKLEDLKDGKHIGASWLNGRMVYAHKVLNPLGIRPVYAPSNLTVKLAKASAAGKTIASVTAGNTGNVFAYKVNPTERAYFDESASAYDGTTLTSGTTEIAVSEGDVIEIVNFSNSRVISSAYVTATAKVIK